MLKSGIFVCITVVLHKRKFFLKDTFQLSFRGKLKIQIILTKTGCNYILIFCKYNLSFFKVKLIQIFKYYFDILLYLYYLYFKRIHFDVT